ncbi:hypothetical protein PIB30_067070 [Stylosanthes scabra]|uniref:Uncharacterized protein n=1 Tax=Stylosanthes scabra TaxID=79078 RepID=A0ABU6ZLA7_9FABA|nr:hypothetical protein [Stylosanthes scabra]
MSTLNSTQKNPSHVDKKPDGLVFYVEVNPALKAILIPSLFYSMHDQSMKESMLIVDARRNRVQVRIMKAFCTAHIVEGIESLTGNGVEAGNEESHDESDPLLTLSLGSPSRARNLLENATAKSIRIGSPVKISSSNNMLHGLSSSAMNIPVNFNLNDPPVLTLGLTRNDFTPAEVGALDKIVKKMKVLGIKH